MPINLGDETLGSGTLGGDVPAASVMGRLPCVLVELHLDRCVNEFGVAPCTATGTKCFKALKHCLDPINYNPSAFIYRFSTIRVDSVQDSSSTVTFPTVMSVSTAPTSISPGKGISLRSSCSVTLQDHPWTDFGNVDPYRNDRAYNPDSPGRGSFWKRLLARNPYWENRKMVVRTGYIGNDGSFIEDSKTFRREYLISKVSGPDENGIVSVEGKDILKLSSDQNAVCPKLSGLKLALPMTETDEFMTLDNDVELRAALSAGQRYFRIEGEVVYVRPLAYPPGVPTFEVDRATLPSYYTDETHIAKAHESGSSVIICHEWTRDNIVDVLYDLLTIFSGIDPSYIDMDSFDNMRTSYLSAYDVNVLITSNLGVSSLLSEISQHNILLWWDEPSSKIKMDILRLVPDTEILTFNDTDNIIAGSFSSSSDAASRISQVWLSFGMRSPLGRLDDPNNFKRIQVSVDTEAEASKAYGFPRIMKIQSRWFQDGSASAAFEVTERILDFYVNPVLVVSLKLDPKDLSVWTGGQFNLETAMMCDENGLPIKYRFLTLESNEESFGSGVVYSYVAAFVGDLKGYKVATIAPDEDPIGTTFPNYESASDLQKTKWAFISRNDGTMNDGTKGYIIS